MSGDPWVRVPAREMSFLKDILMSGGFGSQTVQLKAGDFVYALFNDGEIKAGSKIYTYAHRAPGWNAEGFVDSKALSPARPYSFPLKVSVPVLGEEEPPNKLGFVISKAPDGAGLVVLAITADGFLERHWNARCLKTGIPRNMLRKGDRIVWALGQTRPGNQTDLRLALSPENLQPCMQNTGQLFLMVSRNYDGIRGRAQESGRSGFGSQSGPNASPQR